MEHQACLLGSHQMAVPTGQLFLGQNSAIECNCIFNRMGSVMPFSNSFQPGWYRPLPNGHSNRRSETWQHRWTRKAHPCGVFKRSSPGTGVVPCRSMLGYCNWCVPPRTAGSGRDPLAPDTDDNPSQTRVPVARNRPMTTRRSCAHMRNEGKW